MLKILRIVWKTVVWTVVTLLLTSVLAVVAYKWLPVKYTPLMFIRAHEQWSSGYEPKINHRWVPLDSIAPAMPLAVMGSEDANFMKHHGFDFKEIYRARLEALEGGRERGASTISQQTAKNVFLWPGHSWVRKGLEAYFTVLIEWVWGKERIMEVYLNSIEMADGTYGVQAIASENWGKDASQLSRAQCALIAATLPNPRKYSSKRPSAYILKRQKRILHEMNYVRFEAPPAPKDE